eukprot:2412856-Alexandrium_andersonii.AAC.1
MVGHALRDCLGLRLLAGPALGRWAQPRLKLALLVHVGLVELVEVVLHDLLDLLLHGQLVVGPVQLVLLGLSRLELVLLSHV